MKNFVGGVLILVTMLLSVFFTVANAQSSVSNKVTIDCKINNNIHEWTQVTIVDKAEGTYTYELYKDGMYEIGLTMGGWYDVVFMSDHCATKVLTFDLRDSRTIMKGAYFAFEVVMVPERSPDEVIKAGLIKYVEQGGEFAYKIER